MSIRRTRIKICGITSPDDAQLAVSAGADAIGLIFAESPRRLSMERARSIASAVPAFVSLIAVVVDPSIALVDEALKMGCIPQFCGDEEPRFCEESTEGPYIKVIHIDSSHAPSEAAIAELAHEYRHATLLFDSQVAGRRGGTGVPFAWETVKASAVTRPIIVSGGLTPENVGACVRAVRPYAVDVRSGVERDEKKDPERLAAFVRAVREADAQA